MSRWPTRAVALVTFLVALACGGQAKPPPTGVLGAPIAVGDWVVTVDDSRAVSSTKSGLFTHEARGGMTLRIIDLTVRNDGKNDGFIAGKAKLVDDEDRRFDPTPGCQLATPNVIGGLDQFNPGLERSGSMCFEVAEDATGLGFEFRVGFTRVVIPL